MYAVIRIRGTVNTKPKIKKALIMMNLKRANNMSLWKEDAHSLGMIKMVKDYTTFGKINEATLKEVVEKKARPLVAGEKVDAKKVAGEIAKGKTPKEAGIKNLFTLSPPAGGFERNGIKITYKFGGALGERKEAINELIVRMLQ